MTWLAAALCLICLNPSLPAQPLSIGNYHLYEGASKGLIKGLTTDSIGYIWIATDEGVFRFDGRQSIFFKDEITGGFAKGILRRRNGNLLVAHDLGLTEIRSRVDTTIFQKRISGDLIQTDNRLYFPKELYEDVHGDIWIGEDNTISRYSDTGFKKYYLAGLSADRNIFRSFSFQEDDSGRLWAVSYGGDIWSYDAVRDTFRRYDLSCRLRQVSCLLRVGKNTFLAGAGNGVFELRVSLQQPALSCRRLSGPDHISCGILIDQQLFWGTWDGGLYQVSLAEEASVPLKVGFLPFDEIVGLAYDPRSGLWVSSGENIASLTPAFFHTIALSSPGVPVDALALQPDGSVLVANGLRIDRLRPHGEEWLVEPLDIPVNQTKTALLATSEGIWMGTISGEVWFYDREKDQLQRIDGIPASNKISQLLQDRQGNIWVLGNLQRGVFRIDPQFNLHAYSTVAQTVYETRAGQVLFGGNHPDHYLYYYHAPGDTIVDISRPLPFPVKNNFFIYQMLADKDGALLLASSHGLFQYRFLPSPDKEQAIHRLNLGNLAPDEPMLALAFSEDRGLWISTTNGLVNVNGKYLLLFDRSSGIPGNNLSQRGLLFDNQQNLWVAASRGTAVFRRRASELAATPPPVITEIKVNGLKYPFEPGRNIVIPFRVNLELSFFSPAYPSEDVVYQYRLPGVDTSAWSIPSSDRSRLLTGLGPGAHNVQIRAQQSGGFQWSRPTTVVLEVQHPWYRTGWGILLLIGGGAGLFILGVRLYSWRLLQQKKHLEHLVRERTQEIIRQNQQLAAHQEHVRQLKEKQLQDQIEHSNKQLTTYTLHLIQKNEALRELQNAIYQLMRQLGGKNRSELKHLLSLIDFSFRNDEEWDRFKLYFEGVHAGFFENLVKVQSDLTPQELRLCALIRLNLSIQEIAHILGISPESVKTSRFRLRKKLELSSSSELVDYLMAV